MSVITQNGDSAIMMAARECGTEVVPLLLEAGANIHLQNVVTVSECVQECVIHMKYCNVCIINRPLHVGLLITC